MSKGGGGGGSTTTVQKADPWSGLQGPLQNLYSGAQNWYNSSGPQYYPGQTVAGSNPAMNTALGTGINLAESGPSAYMQEAGTNMRAAGNGAYVGANPAQGYLTDTMNGKYLSPDSNPYLSGMYDAASRPMVSQFQNAIAPGIASQFSAAGRMGSNAHEQAFNQASDTLGHNLGDLANNMYGGAYAQERGLQQGAAGQLGSMNQFERTQQQNANMAAPQFEANKYNDLNALLGIGQFQQGQEQQQIDANKARFDYGQQLPLQKLQALNQLLQGGSVYAGGTSTGQNQTNRNPFAGAVGGAAVGNALGGMLGATGPAGALGGLLLGGLFG